MNTEWSSRFSAIARRTAPPEISWLMAKALEVPGLISLAAGFVDQESLPHLEVAKQFLPLLHSLESGPAALQYGTTQGDLALRTILAKRLHCEGVLPSNAQMDASHLMFGSGSQQILYLLAEALLDEGDIVLLEAPTYFVVLGGFQSRGVRTVGIDTDEQGIRPDKVRESLEQLERDGELHRVKMLYVMSYAANPTGITLSEPRRAELLDILRKYRQKGYPILLVEDAAYRRLCFDPPAPSPIKLLDEDNDLVFYTESFSKSFSPGLRLGFGAGPKMLIDKLVDLKGNHDFGSSNLAQQILKQVLQAGLFDEQVERLKKVYAHKCGLVQEILRETLPSEVRWLVPNGGFYTWVTLPEEMDTGPHSRFFQLAIEEKVLYVPGSLCYSVDRPESRSCSSLRLAFGMIGGEHLRLGCERLGRALQGMTTGV